MSSIPFYEIQDDDDYLRNGGLMQLAFLFDNYDTLRSHMLLQPVWEYIV